VSIYLYLDSFLFYPPKRPERRRPVPR
jgi:hypothetical protein